ncbi:hypothetical protein BWQ96_02647 [Gracilariopsis chorda]|uniref:Uncharacterized protein n=1 Tax=Gracilariopsis chorda TaxID=448386 RepID=A0A2V3IZM3_9FLOR|nr:hypothetical protein BWQ96_02647 [Gracilariopsis chorda]|eukprot:PXF47503.1 hypothetical protein BWQ96_02647 [Gracilariopsis chorda]
MMSSSSFMKNRDRKHSVFGLRGGTQTDPFTLIIDSQGNLTSEGGTDTNFLSYDSQEYQLVKRHRLKHGRRLKHVRALYPRVLFVLSGLDISEKPTATAITTSGVFSSRHQTQHGDATVLIFEETKTSQLSDKGSETSSMVLVIDMNRQVHLLDICLEYNDNMLSNVTMSACAIDYCENWMSGSFKRRDPYNTIATVALSLGVYLSDVKQECLKKLTNLQAGNLEQTHKHDVGNITIGDLVAAGMAKWGSSRLYNDTAKCCFVYENGQLHVVGESKQLRNKHALVKRDTERAPRGSGLPTFTVSVGDNEMNEFLNLSRDPSAMENTADHGQREQEVDVVLCYTGNGSVVHPGRWSVSHKRIWLIPQGCGSFTDATQGRITMVSRSDIPPEGISISWNVLRSWLRGEVVLTKFEQLPDWEFNLLITNWRPVLYLDRIDGIDAGRLKACVDGVSVTAGKRRWALELGLYVTAFGVAVLLCIWHAKQGNDKPSEAVSQFIGYFTFTLGVAAFVSLRQRRMTGMEILTRKTWETSLEGVASAMQVSVAEISARLTMVDIDPKLLSKEDTCACRITDPDGMLSGVGLTRKFRQTAGYIPVKIGPTDNLFVDVFRQRLLSVEERGGRTHFEAAGDLETDAVYKVIDDKYETAYARGVGERSK